MAALTWAAPALPCPEAGLGEWGHQARLGKLESWRRPGPQYWRVVALQAISSLSPSRSAEGHHPCWERQEAPRNQLPWTAALGRVNSRGSQSSRPTSVLLQMAPGVLAWDRDLPEGPRGLKADGTRIVGPFQQL